MRGKMVNMRMRSDLGRDNSPFPFAGEKWILFLVVLKLLWR
jgi:hypothetical protein